MFLVGIKSALIYDYAAGKVHEIGHSFLGTTEASFKNLVGKNTAVNGSNVVEDYIREDASTECDLTVNSLTDDILAGIAGFSKDAEGGIYTPDDQSPRVGLVVVSPMYKKKKDLLYILPNCRVSYETVDLKTNTETKKNTTPVKLTFSAAYDDTIHAKWGYMTVPVDTAGQAMASSNLKWPEPVEDGEYADDAQINPKPSSH